MTDLSSLIERIEKSEWASALLDCGIFAAVSPEHFATPEDRALYARLDWTRNRADWIWLKDIGMKNYTASIDAAMTLIPDGAAWAVTNCRGGIPENADFSASSAAISVNGSEFRADAATPALAICAAALKARNPSHEG